MDLMEATAADVDREARRARRNLTKLLRDGTYLDAIRPMDLLRIGQAAEELAEAIEEAIRRREIDKLGQAVLT